MTASGDEVFRVMKKLMKLCNCSLKEPVALRIDQKCRYTDWISQYQKRDPGRQEMACLLKGPYFLTTYLQVVT